ncbi:hypothetical protein GS421_12470 [Rhodococcus hoagii]|nr:hypothetical protein [Prescottella equi]
MSTLDHAQPSPPDSIAVQPFTADATDAELDDLCTRLAAARLPGSRDGPRRGARQARWDQGVPLADLVEVVNTGATEYDWRSFRAATRPDRPVPHHHRRPRHPLLHRRSTRADATPLLLTHGWPGSSPSSSMWGRAGGTAGTRRAGVPCGVRRCPASATATAPPPPGWGTEEDCGRLGTADGTARLRPVPRARRRLGRQHSPRCSRAVPGAVVGVHTLFAEAPPGLSWTG